MNLRPRAGLFGQLLAPGSLIPWFPDPLIPWSHGKHHGQSSQNVNKSAYRWACFYGFLPVGLAFPTFSPMLSRI